MALVIYLLLSFVLCGSALKRRTTDHRQGLGSGGSCCLCVVNHWWGCEELEGGAGTLVAQNAEDPYIRDPGGRAHVFNSGLKLPSSQASRMPGLSPILSLTKEGLGAVIQLALGNSIQ
jgi:hypothetical protein